MERIARIARSVVDGRYGPEELRHLQRQVDRSVQELDGLAESSRYVTVHLWDPPRGAESPGVADVDDLRRVRVRMLWPVPRARHRLLVTGTPHAGDVLDRVNAAQRKLRSQATRELHSQATGPVAGMDSPAQALPWQWDDESTGVRAMVQATRLQLEALEQLLRRPETVLPLP